MFAKGVHMHTSFVCSYDVMRYNFGVLIAIMMHGGESLLRLLCKLSPCIAWWLHQFPTLLNCPRIARVPSLNFHVLQFESLSLSIDHFSSAIFTSRTCEHVAVGSRHACLPSQLGPHKHLSMRGAPLTSLWLV